MLRLSRIQTIPLVLKLICLGMWPIEIFMFVLEICRKKNLENAPLQVNYNEAERRVKFGLQYLRKAYIAFTVIIVGSIVLIFTVKQKKCGPRQSLSWWVVCSDCQVANCADCFNSGEKSCDSCELGLYYSSFRNQCLDCDDYPDSVTCARCEQKNQCTQCNKGYRPGTKGTPDEGRCLPCNDTQCANCDVQAGVCLECKEGFFLKNGACVACQGVCQ